jgi:hypothetical protein
MAKGKEARDDFATLTGLVAELAGSVRDLARRLDSVTPHAELQAVVEEAERCEREARRLARTAKEAVHMTTLSAYRLNIDEPDGTPRLVMASRHAFPQELMLGDATVPHERPAAGLLFFNDEGAECGGLIFSGSSSEQGYVQTGSLTFDQYRQDQVVQLWHNDVDGQRTAGLRVNDQPSVPLEELIELFRRIKRLPEGPERQAAIDKARRNGLVGCTRLSAGKNPDRSVSLELHDDTGRVRLRIAVTAEGRASMTMYDEQGEATWEQASKPPW